MRVRLAFEPPLPPYKCWHKVDKDVHTIRDLQHNIFETFQLRAHCKSLRLDLEGFYLVPSSPIDGLLRDSDIVSVKRRVKKDREMLPLYSPASSIKRRRKDKESKSTSKRKKRSEDEKGATSSTKSKKTSAMMSRKKKANTASSDSSDSSSSSDSEDDTSRANDDTSSSDSSDSSSSDGDSSSPSSSSSDSSSSSTDSSDSDSDSESESSDDEAGGTSGLHAKRPSRKQAPDATTPKGTGVARKTVPPFQGTSRTRKRNERRKKLNLLCKQSEAEQGSTHSRQQKPSRQEPKTDVPLGEAAQQAKAASSGGSTTTPSTTLSTTTANHARGSQPKHKGPNVFITTSELSDRGALRSNQTPKDRGHKHSGTTTNTAQAAHYISHSSTKSMDSSTSTGASSESHPKHEIEPQPTIDYDSLQALSGAPTVGSRIAYKVLEMSSSYTPVMSEFREAKVLAWDGATRMAELELAPRFRQAIEYDADGQPVLGKFDIFDETDFERLKAGLVQLDMDSVADCRLVEAASW
ncbi:hypothetical protein BGZ73_005200 [Actinomortierella ambigua]|nr:hypothetical protein BGZ73_005200 [Actinomortierella ambigua]